MKKILITGAGSYIGTSFDRYLKEKHPDQYEVDTVDMIDGGWRKKSFDGYDSVFHVAGIAHIKETKKNANLYYEINRDLAIECATKAKQDAVSQFVFLSSMSVYGLCSGYINSDVVPHPMTNYGKSKLEAEERIKALASPSFAVAILRPPMIYGRGCKGNYNALRDVALKFPLFPKVDNARSVLYINNLCEFVRSLIDDGRGGLYFPQNREYMNTTDVAQLICQYHGKIFHSTKLFNPALLLLKNRLKVIEKSFGDLVYDMSMSEGQDKYCIVDTDTSIKETEGSTNETENIRFDERV